MHACEVGSSPFSSKGLSVPFHRGRKYVKQVLMHVCDGNKAAPQKLEEKEKAAAASMRSAQS